MDVFCKIINKEIPSYTLYEDEKVLCFLDVNPESNGHSLIVPKVHYTDINDIDNETLMHIMGCARKIKKLLEEKLNIDGLTLIQNNGDVQEVKHYHLHVKPYYNNKTELKDVKEIYELLK